MPFLAFNSATYDGKQKQRECNFWQKCFIPTPPPLNVKLCEFCTMIAPYKIHMLSFSAQQSRSLMSITRWEVNSHPMPCCSIYVFSQLE